MCTANGAAKGSPGQVRPLAEDTVGIPIDISNGKYTYAEADDTKDSWMLWLRAAIDGMGECTTHR